jgi:uncharacterized protein (TIGR00661 family)
MKILYGIQGTGNGHITRSSFLINSLIKKGCDIDILISGNQHQLSISHPIKYTMKGFNFYKNDDGSINQIKTLLSNNFVQFLKDIRLDLKEYDKIITDFEPITAWAGKWKDKKVIGIGNQYSFLSKNTPRPDNKSIIGEFVLKNFAPVDEAYGIHYDNYDDFISKPIIRGDIMRIGTTNNGHFTIYLPNFKLFNILPTLIKYPKFKFHIFSSEIKNIHQYKNCRIFPTNKNNFLESFLSCDGVISNAGFQTTSEALYCGKKLIVIPIKNQYEQLCNTEALKKIGIISIDNISDISNDILSQDPVKKSKWKDPSKDIINNIIS